MTSSGTSTRRFYHADERGTVASQSDGDWASFASLEEVQAEYDTHHRAYVQRRYVHGPGTDEPLVQYDLTGDLTRTFYHADERGSIVATSDGSGAMATINTYDEYGIPGGGNTGRFQRLRGRRRLEPGLQ